MGASRQLATSGLIRVNYCAIGLVGSKLEFRRRDKITAETREDSPWKARLHHQNLNHNGHRVSCEILRVEDQIWLKFGNLRRGFLNHYREGHE